MKTKKQARKMARLPPKGQEERVLMARHFPNLL